MKKDTKYYFDLIDNKITVDVSLILSEVDSMYHYGSKEFIVVTYAFEKLEEIADSSCVDKLLSYITGSIHDYSSKKFSSLSILGYIADEQSEEDIIKYMGSNHPDLAFIAFCSVCEMAARNALSKQASSNIVDYIQAMVINYTGSNDEVLAGVRTLKRMNHKSFERIRNIALSGYSEIQYELNNTGGFLD